MRKRTLTRKTNLPRLSENHLRFIGMAFEFLIAMSVLSLAYIGMRNGNTSAELFNLLLAVINMLVFVANVRNRPLQKQEV